MTRPNITFHVVLKDCHLYVLAEQLASIRRSLFKSSAATAADSSEITPAGEMPD